MQKKQPGLATTIVPGTPVRMPVHKALERLPPPIPRVSAGKFGGWRLLPDHPDPQEVPIADVQYVEPGPTGPDHAAFLVTLANGQRFRVTVEDD